MIIVGIDPGCGGGLATVDAKMNCESIVMPTMDAEGQTIVDGEAMMDFIASTWVDMAIIEKVHSMPRQGVASTFTFGAAYGGVLTALTARCVPWKLVTPQRWKAAMCLDSDKDKSTALAIKLFPKAADQFARKKDNGRAEAALIALWFHESGLRVKRAA